MGAPGFVVSLNGQELVAVSSEGRNILTVRLHGDVVGEEMASLDVTGGYYGEGSENSHLIWLNAVEISENDEVSVSFEANVATSQAGKTIGELHPEEPEKMGPWQSMEQIFEDLAQQHRVREKFAFELEYSSGAVKRCETKPGEFSFGFDVMWQWLKPEIAKIWLTSNTLESIRDREGGTEHVRVQMRYGESVKVRVKT